MWLYHVHCAYYCTLTYDNNYYRTLCTWCFVIILLPRYIIIVADSQNIFVSKRWWGKKKERNLLPSWYIIYLVRLNHDDNNESTTTATICSPSSLPLWCRKGSKRGKHMGLNWRVVYAIARGYYIQTHARAWAIRHRHVYTTKTVLIIINIIGCQRPGAAAVCAEQSL